MNGKEYNQKQHFLNVKIKKKKQKRKNYDSSKLFASKLFIGQNIIRLQHTYRTISDKLLHPFAGYTGQTHWLAIWSNVLISLIFVDCCNLSLIVIGIFLKWLIKDNLQWLWDYWCSFFKYFREIPSRPRNLRACSHSWKSSRTMFISRLFTLSLLSFLSIKVQSSSLKKTFDRNFSSISPFS